MFLKFFRGVLPPDVPVPIVIWMVAIKHIQKAIILACSHDADLVPNTFPMLDAFGRWPSVAMLAIAAPLAIYAALGYGRKHVWVDACIWPQQFILTISVLGALAPLFVGRFPSGSVHPPLFVWQDQSPMMALVIMHFLGTMRFRQIAVAPPAAPV